MNRFHLLAIGTALVVALAAPAQQTATGSGGPDQHEHVAESGVPTIDQHLKVLSEKLDLTADQQTRIKPILQDLHDATQTLEDKNLSHDERMARLRPEREKADRRIREILNDEQKKKLDQLEHEPHSALHGNVH